LQLQSRRLASEVTEEAGRLGGDAMGARILAVALDLAAAALEARQRGPAAAAWLVLHGG